MAVLPSLMTCTCWFILTVFSPSLLCSHHWFTPCWCFPQLSVLGISSKLCTPRATWAFGPSLGHVPAHLASPGHRRAARAFLHASLEFGDHRHLCPDRDGSWYSVFSLPSGWVGPANRTCIAHPPWAIACSAGCCWLFLWASAESGFRIGSGSGNEVILSLWLLILPDCPSEDQGWPVRPTSHTVCRIWMCRLWTHKRQHMSALWLPVGDVQLSIVRTCSTYALKLLVPWSAEGGLARG